MQRLQEVSSARRQSLRAACQSIQNCIAGDPSEPVAKAGVSAGGLPVRDGPCDRCHHLLRQVVRIRFLQSGSPCHPPDDGMVDRHKFFPRLMIRRIPNLTNQAVSGVGIL